MSKCCECEEVATYVLPPDASHQSLGSDAATGGLATYFCDDHCDRAHDAHLRGLRPIEI